MLFKLLDLIVDHDDPFSLQKLLHYIDSNKMMLSGKQAFPVHDPMGRHIVLPVRGVHGPTDHTS